ncbi:MAG: hypothetical protein HY070_04925 [Chloroflexi bacterium]|nr:hypothetical protein [Chloroflexota bacterium]
MTRTTQITDLETALLKVLNEYIDLKIASLKETLDGFEKKWGMNFAEFLKRTRNNTLGKDTYSFEVEKDFWEWEQAVTLLQHYESLRL